jgi:hypothetical protein
VLRSHPRHSKPPDRPCKRASHEDTLATIDELVEMASLFEERKSLRPGVSPCECFVCRAHIVSISLPSHASRGPPPANLGAVSRQMPSCCSATASRRPRGLCLVTQQHVKMDWQRRGHAGATMVRGQSHRGHWRAVFAAPSHCTVHSQLRRRILA